MKLSYAFEHETDFSKELTKNLDNKKITSEDQSAKIKATHNTKQGRNRIPDITIETEKEIEMKYRKLSNPLYIECKLGRENRKSGNGYTHLKQVHDNLMQLLKYNYDDDSTKVRDLEKYGDRHVAVTTPQLLKKENNMRNFKEEYINRPQLIRTLWKLGLGIMYRDKASNYVIAFNEQEVVNVE